MKRLAVLLVAYLTMALGVALLNNAHLGAPPIGSFPYTIYCITGLTVGTVTFLMNLLLLGGQKVLLGRQCDRSYLLQIPALLVFSLAIDLGMWCTHPLISDNYIVQASMAVVGSLTLAVGIFLQVLCAVVFIPGDGFVVALTRRFSWKLGRTKQGFDLALVCLSIMVSWLALGSVVGVREGTVLATFLVGHLIQRLSGRWAAPVRAWLGPAAPFGLQRQTCNKPPS